MDTKQPSRIRLPLPFTRHRLTRRVTAITVLAGALLLSAGGGIAWGIGSATTSIPAADGTISVCYPTNGPLKPMYLVDAGTTTACPAGFSPLMFNQRGQQGPKGATGATGPRGPQGQPGPAGPAGAGEVWTRSANQVNTPQHAETTIDSLQLPAGTYLVTATGAGYDDIGGNSQVGMFCNLNHGGNALAYMPVFGEDNDPVDFTVSSTVTLSSTGSVDLRCLDTDGSDHAAWINMTAISIGTVHQQ